MDNAEWVSNPSPLVNIGLLLTASSPSLQVGKGEGDGSCNSTRRKYMNLNPKFIHLLMLFLDLRSQENLERISARNSLKTLIELFQRDLMRNKSGFHEAFCKSIFQDFGHHIPG